MNFICRYITSLAVLLLVTTTVNAASPHGPWQEDRYAKARLVFGQIDGDQAHIGLEIKLEPGWHTYWRAPGDAGLPPNFDWTASTGIYADQISVDWPWPTEFRDFDYQTFGYADRVILPLTVPLRADQANIVLNLSYAVCEEVCVPLNAQLSLSVEKNSSAFYSLHDWQTRVPAYAASLIVEARYDSTGLTIDVPGAQGREMIADTEDGRIFYAKALDGEGRARFDFTPSALNPDPTGQTIRIAVMGVDGVRSLVTETKVIGKEGPYQEPSKQAPLIQDPK